MHFPHNKKCTNINVGFENNLFCIISIATYAFHSEITHSQTSNDEMVIILMTYTRPLRKYGQM